MRQCRGFGSAAAETGQPRQLAARWRWNHPVGRTGLSRPLEAIEQHRCARQPSTGDLDQPTQRLLPFYNVTGKRNIN
jgi:hypothetical protein